MYENMNFQKYVIVFLVILLVIILIFLGVNINKGSNAPWPPIISYCPDYWNDQPPPAGTTGITYVPGSNCVPQGTYNLGNTASGFSPNHGLNFTKNPSAGNKDYIGYDKSFANSTHLSNGSGSTGPYTFTGPGGNCGLQAWAGNNGLTWDGITYGTNFECPYTK